MKLGPLQPNVQTQPRQAMDQLLPRSPENSQACLSGVCDLAAQASEPSSVLHKSWSIGHCGSLRERCENLWPVILDRLTHCCDGDLGWVALGEHGSLSTWLQDDQTKPQTVSMSFLPRGNMSARLLATAPSDTTCLDPIVAALDCIVQTLALRKRSQPLAPNACLAFF